AVMLAACSTPSAPAAAISQAPASNGRTGPVISPAPITPPTPPGENTQAFTCADSSGGSPGTVRVTDVRVSQEPGLDRCATEFGRDGRPAAPRTLTAGRGRRTAAGKIKRLPRLRHGLRRLLARHRHRGRAIARQRLFLPRRAGSGGGRVAGGAAGVRDSGRRR